MRYKDTRSIGRSDAVPFVAGEDPKERHARRLRKADQQIPAAVQAFAKIGARLTVTNGGQHWIIVRGRQRAEWWPSSAKLVINQRWQRGIHAHDWRQVFGAVSRMWPKT